MNCGFMTELMERTGFPEEAREALLKVTRELEPEMDELVAVCNNLRFSHVSCIRLV